MIGSTALADFVTCAISPIQDLETILASSPALVNADNVSLIIGVLRERAKDNLVELVDVLEANFGPIELQVETGQCLDRPVGIIRKAPEKTGELAA